MTPFPRQYDIEDENPCAIECERVYPKTEVKLLHEYVGPVRITLVDMKDIGYWQRVWGSAYITLSNLYIAIVLASLVFFSLSFRVVNALNVHIPLCLVGFQLFIPSAILMLNPLFGPAYPILKITRLQQHIFLQVLAFLFGIGGCIHVSVSVDILAIEPNAHIVLGYMVMFFICVTLILGPILYFKGKRKLHCMHIATGLVTYVLSSLCVCNAFFKPSFKAWCKRALVPEVPYILLSITILYTIFVLMSVKCRVRERNKP